MKINLQKQIHTGWRQACGVGLIVIALGGAGFHYMEMNTLAKGMVQVSKETTSRSLSNDATPSVQPAVSPTTSVTGKIKLSIATQTELETLPNIGPSKAQSIIAYRNKYGFKSINDLTQINGIGEKTFEELKPLIEL